MKQLKKIGAVLIAIIAVVSLSSHLYISYRTAVAQRQLQSSFTRESFSPKEIRQDIAHLRSLLEKVHPQVIPSFPLGDPGTALTELATTIDHSLTKLAFYRAIAPVGNLLNDEHTMVFPSEIDSQSIYDSEVTLFPFDIQFVDKRLFVARNVSNQTGIRPGMEILSINGISVEELRISMSRYYSGTRDEQKLFYVQENFREALYFVFGFGESFELSVRGAEPSDIKSYTVTGSKFSKPELQEFHYEVVGTDTILFTYNAFGDKEGTFTDFLQEMFTVAQQRNIQHLIIDIRSNQGGATAYGDEIIAYLVAEPFTQMSRADVTISEDVKNNFISNVPAFIRWFPIQYFHPLLKPLWMSEVGEIASVSFDPVLPEDNKLRFTGDVYVLLGAGAMSSASLFAATVKEYEAGTLIGEVAGGYATLYGNVIDVYLPNSGLKVWMPTSVIYGNGTGPIVPDYIATQTVTDLLEGRDTVLEFARNLSRSE